SFALRPTDVPAVTAARSISPVDSCRTPIRSTSRCAWVPFPAPGGPSRISLITLLPPSSKAEPPRGPAPSSASTPQLRSLDQPLVLMRQEIALNLRNGIHRDADHNQQRGAAEIERHGRVGNQDFR